MTGKRLNALGAVGHGGPLAETGAASGIGGSGATLNATVNPIGSATSYRFEYGPTTEYGNETTVKSAGSGTTPAAVSDTVTGLRPSTSTTSAWWPPGAASRSPAKTPPSPPPPASSPRRRSRAWARSPASGRSR